MNEGIKSNVIDKQYFVNNNTHHNGKILYGEYNGKNMERDSSIENDEINKNEYENNMVINIYRYKFTEEFMKELYNFSKIHQYDDRKSFKEAWNIWIEDNDIIISEEVERLVSLGYNNDIMDKMFKSARYYFRKKNTVKKEAKQRRNYVNVNKDLLDAMDKHIVTKNNDIFEKPSEGFEDFCNKNIDLLKEEIKKLLENKMESKEIMEKIKKKYKNRYFMLINK
jgi:hypothetical protein